MNEIPEQSTKSRGREIPVIPENKSQQEQIPQTIKDWTSMYLGVLVVGGALSVAKRFWDRNGEHVSKGAEQFGAKVWKDSAEPAGRDLANHIIRGCVASAKSKFDSAIGTNRQTLNQTWGRQEERGRQGNSIRSIKIEDTEARDTRDREQGEELETTADFILSREEPADHEPVTAKLGPSNMKGYLGKDVKAVEVATDKRVSQFDRLLESDSDLKEKWERTSEEDRIRIEEIIDQVSDEKKGEVASLMFGFAQYKKELNIRHPAEIVFKTDESVSVKDHEIIKAELLRQKKINDELQTMLLRMLAKQ